MAPSPAPWLIGLQTDLCSLATGLSPLGNENYEARPDWRKEVTRGISQVPACPLSEGLRFVLTLGSTNHSKDFPLCRKRNSLGFTRNESTAVY